MAEVKTGQTKVDVAVPSVSPATAMPGNPVKSFVEGLNIPALTTAMAKAKAQEQKNQTDQTLGTLMVAAMDKFAENERKFQNDGGMTPDTFDQLQRGVREGFVRGAVKAGVVDGTEIAKRLTILNDIYSQLKAPSLQTNAQGQSLVTDRGGNTRLVGDAQTHVINDVLKLNEHFPTLMGDITNKLTNGTPAEQDEAKQQLYDLKSSVANLETATFNAKYATALATNETEKAKLNQISAGKMLTQIQATAADGLKQQLFSVLKDYAAESTDPAKKSFFQNKDLVRATLTQSLNALESTEAFQEYRILNNGQIGDDWRRFKEDYSKNLDQFLGAMDQLERKKWSNSMKEATRKGMVEQYISSGGAGLAIMLGLQQQGMDKVFQSAMFYNVLKTTQLANTSPSIAFTMATFAQQDLNSFEGILTTKGNPAQTPLDAANAFEETIDNITTSLNAARNANNPMHNVTTGIDIYEKIQMLKASNLYTKYMGTGKFQAPLEHQIQLQLDALSKQADVLLRNMDANTVKQLKEDIDNKYQVKGR